YARARPPLPGFGLLGPLGLAGAVLLGARAARGRGAGGTPLLVLGLAATALPPLAFFVLGRLRLPFAALLAIAAAAALDELLERRHLAPRRRATVLAVL